MKFSENNLSRIQNIANKFLLPGILISAGVLRLFRLEYEGLWLDEIGQVMVADNSFLQVILQSVKHYGNTPLDYLVTHFALYVGKSEGILRLPAVIWGVLSVYIIYKVGNTLFGHKAGILAAFLLAFLPIHVYYSREVRFYSLATLFGLLNLLFFLNAIEQNTRKSWIFFGIIQTFALYSHYYILAIVAIESAWLLIATILKRYDRSTLVRFVITTGVTVLLFMPWFIYDSRYEQINRQGLLNASAYFKFVFPASTNLLTANFFFYPRLFNNSMWWIGFSFASVLVGLFLAFRLRRKDNKFSSGIFLLFFIYLFGLGSLVTLDAIASYIFVNRQALIFSPFLILIVAATLTKITYLLQVELTHFFTTNSVLNRWIENGILIGIAAFSFWSLSSGLLHIYSTEIEDQRIHRQDWRGTGEFLVANIRPNDLLLTTHNSHITFYANEIADKIRWLPDDQNFITKMAQTHQRIWILTTPDRLRVYPNLNKFLQQEKPLDLSLHPNLFLYVYSANSSSSDLLLEFLNSGYISPSTLILTDIIESSIDNKYSEEIFVAVSNILKRNDLEIANKATIASKAGETFFNAGDLPKATNLILQAISFNASKAHTWALLGHIYSRQNRLEDAISAYQNAISINPKDFWSNHLLAKRLGQKGKWDEVLQIEERAVQLAPDNKLRSESLTQIAQAYVNLGNKVKACEAFSKAYLLQNNQTILTEMGNLGCPNMR